MLVLFYTFTNAAYGGGPPLLELDSPLAPNAFHETEYILQYCSEHSSDSSNPVQDLVDNLKITYAYFDGETCMSVKKFHDAYLGLKTETGTFEECYTSFAYGFNYINSPFGLQTLSPEVRQFLTGLCNFVHEKTGIWVNANDPLPEGGDAVIKEFMDKFAYTVPEELRPPITE